MLLHRRHSVQCVKYQRAKLMRMSWKLFLSKIKFEVFQSAMFSCLQSVTFVVFCILGKLVVLACSIRFLCTSVNYIFLTRCYLLISKLRSYVSHF